MRLSTCNCCLFLLIILLPDTFIHAQIKPAKADMRTLDSLFAMHIMNNRSVKNKVSPISSFATSKRQNTGTAGIVNALMQPDGGPDICYDTSGRFFLYTDTTTYYAEGIIRLKDRNLFISGQYVDRHFGTGGFALKCDEKG